MSPYLASQYAASPPRRRTCASHQRFSPRPRAPSTHQGSPLPWNRARLHLSLFVSRPDLNSTWRTMSTADHEHQHDRADDRAVVYRSHPRETGYSFRSDGSEPETARINQPRRTFVTSPTNQPTSCVANTLMGLNLDICRLIAIRLFHIVIT
jgi:hypothetical protein